MVIYNCDHPSNIQLLCIIIIYLFFEPLVDFISRRVYCKMYTHTYHENILFSPDSA